MGLRIRGGTSLRLTKHRVKIGATPHSNQPIKQVWTRFDLEGGKSSIGAFGREALHGIRYLTCEALCSKQNQITCTLKVTKDIFKTTKKVLKSLNIASVESNPTNMNSRNKKIKAKVPRGCRPSLLYVTHPGSTWPHLCRWNSITYFAPLLVLLKKCELLRSST